MGIDKTIHEKKRAKRAILVRLATSASLGTLIVLCLYAYNFLTSTSKLAISGLDFHGLSRIEAGEIERVIGDMRGQNILLVPLETYAARFARHPRIRGVQFKRVLPNRVICTFTEREPIALVYSNKFMEVDEEGMIMHPDDLTDLLDLPIITGLDGDLIKEGRFCGNERLAGALQTLAVCKRYGARFADNISELRIDQSGISIVSLREGVVLLVGSSEFENRLRKYFLLKNTIARKNDLARLVDLRFDDQIVLRGGM